MKRFKIVLNMSPEAFSDFGPGLPKTSGDIKNYLETNFQEEISNGLVKVEEISEIRS